MSQVEADPLKFMVCEKPEITLRFGRSLVTKALINLYVGKGYFKASVCHAPGGEDTPDPRKGECVVYQDFFVAGLRFPLDSLVPEIFSRFRVKMHHLTPNTIMQLSKKFWAVRTFEVASSNDAFCRFYELHPQGRKVNLEDD